MHFNLGNITACVIKFLWKLWAPSYIPFYLDSIYPKVCFLNSSFIKQSADWRFAGKERGSRLSCQNHAFKNFVQGSSSSSSNREECWRGTKVWCTFLPLQNLALAANSMKGIFSGATDLDHFKYLVVNSFKARSGSVSFPQFYSVPRREFSESHFLIGISCFSSL